MRKLDVSVFKRKLIMSAILVLIGWLSVTSRLDYVMDRYIFFGASEKASLYINDTIARATATYALLRASNALVSIIKESEIKVPGFDIALGQVLDPIDDLIEQGSWIMLLALTSLGIQKILLMLSPWLAVQLLLSFGLFILFLRIWWPWKCKKLDCRTIGIKMVIFALVIRLFVPLMMMTSNMIYERFLKDDHVMANAEMSHTIEDLKKLNKEAEQENESGLYQKIKNFIWDVNASSLKRQFDDSISQMNSVVKHLINLIVVFTLQTVLLPIVFLWLVIRFLNSFLNLNLAYDRIVYRPDKI